MKQFFVWIANTIDSSNCASSMRVVMYAVTTCILGVWTSLCIYTGRLLPLDESILLLFGMVLTGKYLGKREEVKESKQCPTQP